MPKSRKEQIEDIVESAIPIREYTFLSSERYYYNTIIDKPNILVMLYNGKGSSIKPWLGWSKVNWPDEWSERYGVNVALRKAAAAMIKS